MARRATCQSNMKQLCLSMTQYVLDNDSMYPGAYISPQNHYASATFNYLSTPQLPNQLDPYIRNVNIWHCPSAKFIPFNLPMIDNVTTQPSSGPITGGAGCGYATIGYNQGQFNIGAPAVRMKEAAIPKPAELMLFMDTGTGAESNGAFNARTADSTDLDLDGSNCTTGFAINAGRSARHDGGANVAFCDGHVKWEPADFYFYGAAWRLAISAPAANLKNWYAANE